MGGERAERDIGIAGGGDSLDVRTPYELTLTGVRLPWWLQFAFNGLAALALALIGPPLLAAAWALAGCAADAVLRSVYDRWFAAVGQTDSARGLRQLALCAAFRSSLWMSAPVAVALTSQSPAALAYAALIALSLAAVAISVGWTSRGVWIGFAAPAVLGLVVPVLPGLSPLSALGVLLGACFFSLSALLIALDRERCLSVWSVANERRRAAMADLRAALAASEAAERRLRIAVEIAGLHVFEVDHRRGTVVSLGAENDFFEQPMTFELMRDDPYCCVAPEHRAQAAAAWERYARGEGPFRAEYRINRSDGCEVWASSAAEMTCDEAGRPLTVVGALQNITERKRSELALIEARDRAEAGSRAKGEFLAVMSHEIRTPLNGVLGMAQAMEREELSPVQRRRLDVIRQSGESLLALLNSILDLSNVEAGKLELEQGQVDVDGVAWTALQAFSAQAAEKGVTLSLRTEPEARGVYAGDSGRIGQILCNLISNAVKFTERGSVEVSVNRIGEVIVIKVADTGIGISTEQQQLLFEKFVQVDASITRPFGGSGLGLAVSKQLVQMMGGSIEVESAPDAGSTFTVRLDLPRLGDSSPAGLKEPAHGPAELLPALRILAVEDNTVNQLVLKTLLQQVGVEPTMVADGQQALEAWEAGDWHLILMDVQMPIMDGVTATRGIREREASSGRPRTPIIALTANVMAHQVEEYRLAGMDDVIAKPIEAGRLLQTMEMWLVEKADAAEAASAAAAF